MEIRSYPDAASFLKEYLNFLEQEESANNLMLGLALGMRRSAGVYKDANFWGASQEGRPVFCALQTPPRNLIAYGVPRHAGACAAQLQEVVIRQNKDIPGVIGPRALAEAFAGSWCNVTGTDWNENRAMGVFQLERVVAPAPSWGSMRVAGEEDEALVLEWISAFNREALGEDNEAFNQQLVANHLKRGDLYIWENPLPVSMAAATRPSRNGITINAVYTPPEHRGKGYASNCVARLSQAMLDKGYRFCALFTDLKNPTSNKIYQAIGYRKVSEFIELTWG